MELAIEEMLQSRSEHGQRYDPLVGAVLVGANGTVLGKAHRGSLRAGDHAEFTLIERYLGNTNLDGSTLYVTLEPCTFRELPKISCARRIIAARVKRVFVGMLDPNPKILGHGVNFLQRNGVEVDFFDHDLHDRIRHENRLFGEQFEMAEESIPESEERESPSEKEKEPLSIVSIDDLAPEVIEQYLDARKMSFIPGSAELWEFFRRNGFVARDLATNRFIPTVAGLLLFGKTPEDILMQSKVKAEAHKGVNVIAPDIGGPLLLLPEKIKEFLNKNMQSFAVIHEFKRVEEPEYPWEAIREAVVNALVHRDYREGARVSVQLLKDRLVIKSPGLPLRPISLEKIRSYNAVPYSRNPRIAETFFQMDLMEERGWGLPKMRDHLVNRGLPPPQFSIESGYFIVTFYEAEVGLGKVRIAPELQAKLTERQKKILDLARERGRVDRAGIVAALKVSKNTVARDLEDLVSLGVMEQRGKGPSTHYVLFGS